MATQGIPVPDRSGLLRVVSNAQLVEQERAAAAEAAGQGSAEPTMSELAAHIRRRMEEMRNFRNTEGISDRLIAALRTYKGQYDAARLSEIKKFGGSEVYARITATKCRGASALLRDVYLGPERPWAIVPTPDPEVPTDVDQAINELVKVETATLMQSGQQIDPQMISDRVEMLRKAAEQAAKKQAYDETKRAEDKLHDLLVEGGYYDAFSEFLLDLPIFPFAVIKGPTVRNASTLKWVNGMPTKQVAPKMFWNRVSPFDLYWSASAATTKEAEFIERIRLTREDLTLVRNLPGYNGKEIDQVLARYNDVGFRDWFDVTDTQRADMEDRERWPRTTSGLIDTVEYHGSVSGQTLIDWGMTDIPDPLQEYHVQAWLIDRHVIKAQLNVTPSQRAPYYITSYEKVPGALIGEGLPDVLDDVQQVCNATLRALVNNLSISSGPQVVVNDMVTSPGETDDLYPWKRWHVNYDPLSSSTAAPITFFQPNSNADVLLGVYERFSQMADDISALPRYMMGTERVGGAGRTASGLAMLMGNAAKSLQNVAATIDRDVWKPMLTDLYELVMLTMPGVFKGDEAIVVKGVTHATKREQDRMRQLEFLQLTTNPIDMQIMGPLGRANVLRSVSNELGLDQETIVPDDATLKSMIQGQQAAGQAAAQAGLVPPGQQPSPKPNRAAPEEVRRPVEQEFTNQATGRPGMRGGG